MPLQRIFNNCQVLAKFEALLLEHCVETWFPRSLDIDYGGFYCDFDRKWNLNGTQEKLIEFQARQTLFAAEALRVFPNNEVLSQATSHGLKFLKDKMWDEKYGGWYHRLDRQGTPLEGNTKHSHGAAYAILACTAIYESLQSKEALDLAQLGFRWLDQHAHDSQHGGYLGFHQEDGTPILESLQSPLNADCDAVGTLVGLKDINVHSDLLETFTRLYAVWPDPVLYQRLVELLSLIENKMLIFGGALPYFYLRDWTPYPHLVNFGYQFQTVFRLIQAGKHFADKEKLKMLVTQLMEHTLFHAHDNKKGGFYYAGPGCLPNIIEGQNLKVQKKVWWVQLEALKALLALKHFCPEEHRYERLFRNQLEYIQKHFIDYKWKGIYSAVSSSKFIPLVRMKSCLFGDARQNKGSVWKDVSHDGRTWLYCASNFK